MTRTLVWDAAPGETRCLLLDDDQPVALHLLRDCHAAPSAPAGARVMARLMGRLDQGRGLIRLDSGEEAILQPLPKIAEGARLMVDITRERVPEPGQWKRALARPADADTPPLPDARTRLLAQADRVLCPDIASAEALGPVACPVEIDAAAVAALDMDLLLDAARSGLFPFADGVLSIERTRAMTVIDVDGTLPPRALNCAAAQAIARALRLFAITGPIGIDFVSMDNRADRQAVDAALAAACADLGAHERTAINGFGFCQIIRPRLGPSIAEQLCATTPGRLSPESQALALLRMAVTSTGVGARHITARPPVIDLLRSWPDALARVRQRLGTDVKLVSDPAQTGYGHVHVSPA